MPTQLQECISHEDEAGLRGVLVANSGNPSWKDAAGLTALHYAAYFGKTGILKLLLDMGADLEARAEKYGSTPLQWATYCGIKNAPKLDQRRNQPVIAELLRRGASYDIMSAVANLDAARVEAVLATDAVAVNSKWMNGFAPLHVNADLEIGRSLLATGADLRQRSDDGTTPLIYLCNRLRANEALVRLYLDRGAEANAQSGSGRTALHAAVRRGHEEIVKLLLARGANRALQNDKGETALDKAINLRKKSLRSLLQ